MGVHGTMKGHTHVGCRTVIGLLLLLAGVATPCQADEGPHDVAVFGSGAGNLLYLGAGLVAPLVMDRAHGKPRSLRALDAVATSVAASEILKLATHERRPDGSKDYASFPSGHTTAVFAL